MADMGKNEMQVTSNANELRRFRDRASEQLAQASERNPYNGTRPSLLSFHRLLPVPAAVSARASGAPSKLAREIAGDEHQPSLL